MRRELTGYDLSADLQAPNGVLQRAWTPRRGPHHQGTIRDCLPQSWVFARIAEHVLRLHGGARLTKGNVVRVDQPQLRKSKIADRASSRPNI